jgi:membrane associated rhomboid family serine protease
VAAFMTIPSTYDTFRTTVNLRLFSVYLALTLIIPAITILVEYLITTDPSFRTSLQINLQNFHIYQLFTSSFVHLNFDHFVGNVTAYLLIITYGLLLATALNRKRLYLALTKVIVVAFILFGAVFALLNMTTMVYAGLSGIDAALAGLLFLFWLMYLEKISQKSRNEYYGVVLAGVLLLCAGLTVRFITLYHGTRTQLLFDMLVVMTVILVLTVIIYRHQFVTTYHALREFSWSSRILTFAIVLVFAYFIWNVFPDRLGSSVRGVSIFLHLGGIILGIVVGYLVMRYLDRIAYFHDEKEVISG